MLLTLLSPSGAASGVTIDCAAGVASASGLPATVVTSATISCALGVAQATGNQAALSSAQMVSASLGTANASGQAATVTAGGASPDPRLDQILALLTGKKVYDPATKLWRVYSPDNTEIADESGILMRGLHGWMLASGNNAGNGQYWIIQARRRLRR